MTAPVRVDLGHSAAAIGAAPARAGGGQSSNSGSSGSSSRSSSSGSSSRGGSSGSGFGSSSGIGTSSGIGARSGSSSGGAGSAIGGLVCILLVVVVVVVLVVMFQRKGAAAGGATPDTPPPPPPPVPRRPEMDEALARIAERDPAFDEAGFLNSVATSFSLVQRAWCEQLPAESRKVMADGIWLRHRTQIEEMAAAGRRNVLEDLHIGRSEIISCVTDADSDSVTVRIHAYSRDYDVAVEPAGSGGTGQPAGSGGTGQPAGSGGTGQPGPIVRGDRVVRLWTEDWTFTRSSSAVTKAGAGTRQTCPNCGAPLDLDAAGTCAYCKQLVMAGAYDWVLSRIEQVYATD